MNKQPTQEQIRKFWEWCGLKQHLASDGEMHWFEQDKTIVSPTSNKTGLPLVDLNNLFKYAVPKLPPATISLYPDKWIAGKGATRWCCELKSNSIEETFKWHRVSDNDPALALFWAIWEVIEK